MSYPAVVFLVMDWLWFFLGLSCLGSAALLALGKLKIESMERRWPAVLAVFPAAALATFKVAQFHAFYLFNDSSDLVNVVWQLAHGYGFMDCIRGSVSVLSYHFGPTHALLVPILWLGGSAGIFAAAHGAALGAAVAAAYALGRQDARSSLAGIICALLALSHPLLSRMAVSPLDIRIYAPALFLWAAVAWTAGWRKTAGALFLLFLGTVEQACFVLFGLALHSFLRSDRRGERLQACGVMALAVFIFGGEMAVVRWAGHGLDLHNKWHFYEPLGASGGSPEGLLRNAVERPWIFPLALVWPPAKLWTVVRTFLGLGFFPFLSGSNVLPALAAWLPQQLASPATSYQQLVGHYPGVIMGPLIFAASRGLASSKAGRRPFVASWALVVAGFGFLSCDSFAPREGAMPSAWKAAVPHVTEHIPPGAKLWCDQFLTPHFALRRHIKRLPVGPDADFESGLFIPDRVLLSTYWVRSCDRSTLKHIFDFLDRRGYVRVFQEEDLIVLAIPGTLEGTMGPLEAVRIGNWP